jgi:hypothetical protein
MLDVTRRTYRHHASPKRRRPLHRHVSLGVECAGVYVQWSAHMTADVPFHGPFLARPRDRSWSSASGMALLPGATRRRRRRACRDDLEVSGHLPAGGDVGCADPGAMGPRRWNRQQAPALDLGKLPAALMDQPVVAVAEQDEVVEGGVPAVPPMQDVMGVGPHARPIAAGPHAALVADPERGTARPARW